MLLLSTSANGRETNELRASASDWQTVIGVMSGDTECATKKSWRWGSEGKCPLSYVGYMEVSRGEVSVFVPMSAFSDLGTPRSVSIRKRGRASAEIVVNGGDAALSYQATFVIRAERLVERRVRSGEFPASAWERTTYSYTY